MTPEEQRYKWLVECAKYIEASALLLERIAKKGVEERHDSWLWVELGDLKRLLEGALSFAEEMYDDLFPTEGEERAYKTGD